MSTTDGGMVPRAEEKITFVFYYYEPSLPAGVLFTVLFAILTALHIWRLVRHRALYFIPFLIGGACNQFPSLTRSLLPHAGSKSS